MKKSFFKHLFNIEYVISSIVVMLLVYLMGAISDMLPEADETSFLNPIFDRIDFLNIDDVSLDAIFATKNADFPDKRIVIVNIGEVAPAPDGKIARLLYKLDEFDAKVVGIDVIFDELHFERFPEHRLGEVEALKQAFADVDNVVLVNGYDKETLEPSLFLDPEVKKHVDHYGFADLEKDDDGVVRRFWPYRTVEGERWLSFPVQITRQYNPELVDGMLSLPEEPQIIYYRATHGQFQGQTLPIDDVIDHPEPLANFYGQLFKDAIVLVGFVNEGGMWYPGDTHKTPMGKKIEVTARDGSSRMGMEGPDMSGLLIHANVINMLLTNEFIYPVPAWVDWLMVFVLAYISIALYRILRAKPPGRFSVGILITLMLGIESLMVFFVPIIAFFNFDVKISYDLMATGVLLFIPANALVILTKVFSYRLLFRWKERRNGFQGYRWLKHAFYDDETFALYIRSLHATLATIHYSYYVGAMERVQSDRQEALPAIPRLSDWAAVIPGIESVVHAGDKRSEQLAYFLRYVDGMKDRLMRDAFVKDFFFSTELPHFNHHHYFEEWEILLPYVFRLNKILANSVDGQMIAAVEEEGGEKKITEFGTRLPASCIQVLNQSPNGMYLYREEAEPSLLHISPYIMYTECKLHRRKELFVFGAMVKKQFDMDRLPIYYGDTLACEPILPERTYNELAERIVDE